jgi:hypothetical protein
MAAHTRHIRAITRTMDAVRPQVLDHFQITLFSCPISALRSAMDVVFSKISHHV